MNHRERVLTALDHQEPDRVPLDLGGTQTSILVQPYAALKSLLGLTTPTELQNRVLGLALVEEGVLKRFDVDLRHILPGVPSTWKLELLPDDSFYDEWGVRWHRPAGGYYYDMVEHPLAAATWEAFEAYPWPDPHDPGRVAGAAEAARAIREQTDYALEAGLIGLWETSWFPVGFEQWLLSLGDNPPWVEAVLDRVLEVLQQMHGAYLDVVGPYLDLVTLWDDYGAEAGPLISPEMWRRLIKPRLAALVSNLKSKTRAHVAIHSCGSLRALLDDLIEVGIEVINPVQVTAAGMQPAELKARYGRHLSFWGGIDTRRVLPRGRPTDVECAIRETIRALGPGGGYILAAVHNLQPDVPPENIVTLYDTARRAGVYPLQG